MFCKLLLQENFLSLIFCNDNLISPRLSSYYYSKHLLEWVCVWLVVEGDVVPRVLCEEWLGEECIPSLLPPNWVTPYAVSDD